MPKFRVPCYIDIIVEAKDDDEAAIKVAHWLGKPFIADPVENMIVSNLRYSEAGYGEFEKIEVFNIPTRMI